MLAIKHFTALLLMLALAPCASAQELQMDDLLGIGGEQFGPKTAEVTAKLVTGRMETGAIAYLHVEVVLPLNHYISSLNPEIVGPTVIDLEKIEGLEPIDATFQPTRKPKASFDKILEQNVEKFYNDATWIKRFKITDARAAAISGELTGQFCTSGKNGQGGNCTPIRPPAKFAVSLEMDETLVGESQETVVFAYTEQPTRGKSNKPDPLSLAFKLTPANPKSGDEVQLDITMKLDEGWHTFSQFQNPANTGLPTKIQVDQLAGLEPIDSGFTPNHEPELVKLDDGKEQSLFHDAVTWTRRYRVVGEKVSLTGAIEYQACENSCLPPMAVSFALGDQTVPMVAVPQSESGLLAAQSEQEASSDEPENLAMALLFAFLGGLILNVMPCVLPVLAIKVLSFVKQAGESRSQIFILNVAYATGVVTVFLILAALAVTLKLGWGDLFQHSAFNFVMAAMIFAMALSLLGVFEIPIPGMGGGQSKEGPSGAFLTGIFATILATPCSGPFLGPTFIWSVKQSPTVTYLVWGVMGLGMASPYLLFAVVPSAVKLLPKPGMWMVRFKEFAGFVLLLTVVYFFYVLEDRFAVPLLIGLVALGIALWMVGSLYQHNSSSAAKWRVRLAAAAICVCGFFGAKAFVKPAPLFANELPIIEDGQTLPWRRFSEERLFAMLYQKKTVMIDFTADWCQSCKLNEHVALNTAETLELVQGHDIVPLYADKTNRSSPSSIEIDRYLERFESISIPLTVIIPNGDMDNPIILRDAFTQKSMTDAIKKATGNSKVSTKAKGNRNASATGSVAPTGRALPWVEFTPAKFADNAEQQENLVVHMGARWNQISGRNEYLALNTPETYELLENQNFTAMYIDCTNPLNQDTEDWLGQFNSGGFMGQVTIIVPAGRVQDAMVLRDSYSQQELFDTIKRVTDNKSLSAAN